MSPRNGKAGTAVAPTEPKGAAEADKANPGEVEKVKAEQRQTQSGKYGSVKVQPHKPPKGPKQPEQKKHWIEIKLVDENGDPVPGEKYRITLPDGSVTDGTLDGNGCARVDGIDPGQAEVTFPELDEDSWKES